MYHQRSSNIGINGSSSNQTAYGAVGVCGGSIVWRSAQRNARSAWQRSSIGIISNVAERSSMTRNNNLAARRHQLAATAIVARNISIGSSSNVSAKPATRIRETI